MSIQTPLSQGTASADSSVPYYDEQNSVYRQTTVQALATLLQGLLTAGGNLITQYAAPSATGFTVAIAPPTLGASVMLLMTPAGAYAAGTITLPLKAECKQDQEILVFTTQAVTALTVSGNGATVRGAPAALGANGSFRLRYDVPGQAWNRISGGGAADDLTSQQVVEIQQVMSGSTATITLNGSNKVATVVKNGRTYNWADPDSTHETITSPNGSGIADSVVTITKDGSGRALEITGNFELAGGGTSPSPADAFTLSGPTTGTTGSPATFTVTPNGPLSASTVVTLAASNSGALSVPTLTFASGATAEQTFTVTRATDGTSSVSITNDGGLTNAGTPIVFVSSSAALQLTGINWTPNRDGSGNVLQSDFEQLPVATGWLEVQGADAMMFGQVETPYYTPAVSGDGYTEILTTWSGMALNRTAKLGYVWRSGGHGGTNNASNALYQLDFNKLTWSRPLNRTLLADQQSWNAGSNVLTTANQSSVEDCPQLDGRPSAVHTYDGIIWLPPGVPGAGSVNGGLTTANWCRTVLNLDDFSNTTLWWMAPNLAPIQDWSYACAFRDGNAIYSPRNSAYVARFDLAATQSTTYSASSVGSLNYTYATNSGTFFERGQRAYCDMPERRECVAISGKTGEQAVRMRYGAALDAGSTNWVSYNDVITLTSVNGTDHLDLDAANFAGSSGAKFQGAGIDYDHATGTIWMQSNGVGESLYRITGISTNTWTVYKVPTSAATRTSINGTFGRFRVIYHGSVLMAYRVSGVSHPLQAMRLA